jgi:G:T/U-mismatch repair DNA glycosylase
MRSNGSGIYKGTGGAASRQMWRVVRLAKDLESPVDEKAVQKLLTRPSILITKERRKAESSVNDKENKETKHEKETSPHF